jgi:hypothetical protein
MIGDTLVIERDIYETTSCGSSGITTYGSGVTSATETSCKTYGFDEWGYKAKNNLIKEIWGYNDNSSTDACTTNWLKYDYGTDATTVNVKRVCNDMEQIMFRWNTICDGKRWREVPARRLTPEEQLKEILQKRQAPLVIAARKTIDHTSDLREMRARETLKRVLGDEKFKSFIKKGFVSVKAKSGLVYQIFPAHGITAVYRDGEMVERLCVVLRGEFPPTDSLIMRYLLILNDEKDFRKHAIKHQVIQRKVVEPVEEDNRSLTEIWKGLKVA